MIRKTLFAVFFLLLAASAGASEYGNYDAKRLMGATETPSGKKFSFNAAYLDQILNDLSAHARNYPAQFDSPQDRQRAVQDVKTVSGMLDILTGGANPSPAILVRAAYLNSMGHNLEIAGSAQKADALFRKLLAAQPADPRGNYMYGTFLSSAGKPGDALPYLEKALSAGVSDAAYTIAMTHLALGQKDEALKSLADYKRSNPGDADTDKLIEAIRSGKIELKKNPG